MNLIRNKMNFKKITLGAVLLAFFMQSCEQIEYADPTHMEDYVTAKEFTPDWTDNLTTMDDWETLPNDGESYAPYWYEITNKPGSIIKRTGNGINFDAYGGWWDQRFIREGFDIAANTDFEIEVKLHIVAGTGDAVWQKGGLIIGDIGGSDPIMWFSLENPLEPNNGRVNLFCPPADTFWFNMDEGNFSVFDWQVLKVTRTGNTLKIYRNDIEINTITAPNVSTINGKVGLSAEALSVEYEYLMVNGVKDDFSDLDNPDMGNWSNLNQHEVTPEPPSVWTPGTDGLHVIAKEGWNHRAMGEEMVSGDFTTEFKVKVYSPEGLTSRAGIIVGELGNDPPSMIVALNNTNGGNSVTKLVGGVLGSFSTPGLNVNSWQTIRVQKVGDNLYIYIDGIRAFYEKGAGVANISGRLGMYVEGCEAEFEFISFKAD